MEELKLKVNVKLVDTTEDASLNDREAMNASLSLSHKSKSIYGGPGGGGGVSAGIGLINSIKRGLSVKSMTIRDTST